MRSENRSVNFSVRNDSPDKNAKFEGKFGNTEM